MSNMNQTDILLETGTNELEILEFIIAGNRYGINVAKIVELMQAQKTQPMPRSNPYIEGIFQPRDEVYTILDLAKYLDLPPSESPEKDIYIITNFNKLKVAFHVHSVENIYRISWSSIEKPNSIIYNGEEGIVTGIAKVDDRIISILDLEKITFDIGPETGIKLGDISGRGGTDYPDASLLVSEDSPLLRKLLLEALHTAGFSKIVMTTNGQEAWDILEGIKTSQNDVYNSFDCVITDIEMPQMDGHRLTKLIKGDPQLRELPVIIFSSLINDAMRIKGIEAGADAQLSKPEIGDLIDTLNEVLRVSKETFTVDQMQQDTEKEEKS